MLTIFVCPLCRRHWERPKPYTKGQSSLCSSCKEELAGVGDTELDAAITAIKERKHE